MILNLIYVMFMGISKNKHHIYMGIKPYKTMTNCIHKNNNNQFSIIYVIEFGSHYSIVIHLNISSISFDGILYLSLTVYDLSVYLILCP